MKGLVLSGGGARGFGHLGALQYLYEQDFKPGIIVASSVGALVGVCLAAGKTPDEITTHFLKHNLLKRSFSLSRKGVLSSRRIVNTILSFAGVQRFEELSIPLHVNAMNINTGEERVFSEGDLAAALRASIGLPMVCPPMEVDGEWYVDGSLIDVLPTHLLLPGVDLAVVIDISLHPAKIDKKSSAISIVTNAIIFGQRRLVAKGFSGLLISVPMKGYGLLEYSNKRHKKMVKMGYDKAKEEYEEYFNKKEA